MSNEARSWKKYWNEKLPKRPIATNLRNTQPGISIWSTGSELETRATSHILAILKEARNNEENASFLGLLEALIEATGKAVDPERLVSQGDIYIMMILGIELPEEDADGFEFSQDPTLI